MTVEVSIEVAECLEEDRRKEENLHHEQRRHWDDRELDEYIIATEGRLPYCASTAKISSSVSCWQSSSSGVAQ